jgi:hypothetical protein
MAGTVHEDQYTAMIIWRLIFLGMRNVLDKFAEQIKTHVLYYEFIFGRSCHL